MTAISFNSRTLAKFTSTLLTVIMLTGCAVRLIAPYDAVTDEKVSNLQEEVVTKMIEWEREVPPIAKEYAFYDHAQSVLEILILRNQNIEKSDIIVKSLQKLLDNINILKSAHERAMLNTAFIEQVKPDIMAQFNVIQIFQMALKKADNK